jgi:nucleotide-binding universal stress UspA family protein
MNKTFTKILVPVDFSAYSTEALIQAASIAERFSSSLLVLHVISKEVELGVVHQQLGRGGLPLLGPFSETLEVPTEVRETIAIDLRERARTALQEFLPPQLRGWPLELLVAVGHPFEQILETAAAKHVDLIVMGTHGRTGLTHMMLGSVAERVVRLASCPVLTVKAASAA